MRNILFLFIGTFIAFGCQEETEQEIYDRNQTEISQYLSDNNLTAEMTESGLWYIIHEEGGTIHPNEFNEVTVDYEGTLLDGAQFDAGENVSFFLLNVILGWREGLQLIGRGGDITLLIPSSLAYRDSPPSGSGIPANEVLKFEVTLHDFN